MRHLGTRLAAAAAISFGVSGVGACSLLFSPTDSAEQGDAAIGTVDAAPKDVSAIDADISPDANGSAAICSSGSCSISVPLSSGDQDVSQEISGDVLITDDQVLGLGDVSGLGDANELVGLRFENLDIPKGAQIILAQIQFTAAEDDNRQATLILNFVDSAQAQPFNDELLSIRSTVSSVSATWSLASPNGNWQAGESGLSQRTTNFLGAMQYLVNLGEWVQQDNAIVVVVKGMLGSRRVKAFESGPENGAVLLVQYDQPSP